MRGHHFDTPSYISSGEDATVINQAWEQVKEILFSDNPEEEVTIVLPQSYVDWLRYNNNEAYRNLYEQLYEGTSCISAAIDVAEIYKEVVGGTLFRQIKKRVENDIKIEKLVFNDNCVNQKSSIVRKLKERFKDLGFVPFEKWEAEVGTMQSQIAEDVKEERLTDIVAGHRMVDLGLSVCWADCNVGAESPEQYGGYYAWGEVEEKAKYDLDTYRNSGKYKVKIDLDTCRCIKNQSKTQLDEEDDVAQVKWGNNWRMPTYPEIKELVNECSWEWITVNDITGYKVTGPNGNSVLLPAAGFYTNRDGNDCSQVHLCGEMGYYWCSSLLEEVEGTGLLGYYANLGTPLCFGFRKSFGSWYTIDSLSQGFTVRPVIDKK